MAPKKEEAPKKVLLGRAGNNVKMGVVGMPNVGKSSFYNAVAKLNVAAENFPFCTIDPNTARIPVPDKRFKFLCNFWKSPSDVPAMLTITDIAGLVKGAAAGAGLGNAFLSHIQAVDGIYHMVSSELSVSAVCVCVCHERLFTRWTSSMFG
jgi:obg-like ATPase 1